jgi:predicted acyltransferase
MFKYKLYKTNDVIHSDKCCKVKRKHNERENSVRSRAGGVTIAHKHVPWILFHLVAARVMTTRHAMASDNVTTGHLLRRGAILPSLWYFLEHHLVALGTAPFSHTETKLA